MFLTGIEQLRKVEWGKTYLWDIKFLSGEKDKLPAPFDQWFPATNVDETLYDIAAYSFDGGMNTGLKIPQSSNAKTIRITFVDKGFEKGSLTLAEWLSAWANAVVGNGKYVLTLYEAVKSLIITKMNSQREITAASSYYVFPEGKLSFVGTSESGIPTYDANFIVAGRGKYQRQ